MSGVAYQLVYRLESPLHVGWRKTGNLMQTRAYVPGRIFWGAVTANLTRCLPIDGKEIDKAYQDNGVLVKNQLKFGYFFLAENPERPYIPTQQNNEVCYGSLAETQFQRKYLKSLASTVIATDSFAAEEGSLHEVEFISPSPISDLHETGKPVFLIGHLFVKSNDAVSAEGEDIIVKKLSLFENIIHSLQIGGERRYGFGKITLCKDRCQKVNHIFDYHLDLEKFQITVPKGKPFLAHTCIKGLSQINGEIEPLVSRQWASDNDKSGPGHDVHKLGICYAPGSTSSKEETFTIGEFGIWHKWDKDS